MTAEHWLSFWVAAMALALVPGPTVTVIIGNALRYGTRAGLMNVLGAQIGLGLWLVLAGLGLTTLIDFLGHWLVLLRYGGAAWLIWLGIRMWRSGGLASTRNAYVARTRRQGSFFVQGVVTMVANPKLLVLFGALIPPFLPIDEDGTATTLVLGVTFGVIAAMIEVIYALGAGQMRDWMTANRLQVIAQVSGACLVAGGLLLGLPSG